MTQMLDSEDEQLPPSNDGAPTFDLFLRGAGNDGKPWLGLDVPMTFVVLGDDGTDHTYASEGLLVVDLRDVLEEYLHHEHMEEDGGASLPQVEALLREYADKISEVRRVLVGGAVAD